LRTVVARAVITSGHKETGQKPGYVRISMDGGLQSSDSGITVRLKVFGFLKFHPAEGTRLQLVPEPGLTRDKSYYKMLTK